MNIMNTPTVMKMGKTIGKRRSATPNIWNMNMTSAKGTIITTQTNPITRGLGVSLTDITEVQYACVPINNIPPIDKPNA